MFGQSLNVPVPGGRWRRFGKNCRRAGRARSEPAEMQRRSTPRADAMRSSLGRTEGAALSVDTPATSPHGDGDEAAFPGPDPRSTAGARAATRPSPWSNRPEWKSICAGCARTVHLHRGGAAAAVGMHLVTRGTRDARGAVGRRSSESRAGLSTFLSYDQPLRSRR